MAQQEKEKAFKRVPHLDVVLGTHAVGRLPKIIAAVQSGKTRIADTAENHTIFESPPRIDLPHTGPRVSRFVTIIAGM